MHFDSFYDKIRSKVTYIKKSAPMFSPDLSDFHPFSFYDIGRPVSYGSTHLLRPDADRLLEINDSGLPTENGTCSVYYNSIVRQYPLEPDDKKKLMDSVAQYSLVIAAQEKKLPEIAKPLSGHKTRVDFKPQATCTVLPHEFAVTTADSIKPVLGTFGAVACLIIAIYDAEAKKAVLTHVDAFSRIDSLTGLLELVSPASSTVHLCGGDMSSQVMCMEIVELIETHYFKIANADIVRTGSIFDSASLAIDARTGAIYSPIFPKHLEAGEDQAIRLQLAGMAMGKSSIYEVYDGSLPDQKSTLDSSDPDSPLAPLVCTEAAKSKSFMSSLCGAPCTYGHSIMGAFFALANQRHYNHVLQHEYDKRYGITIVPH